MGERSAEATRAIQENFETRFLATAQAGQTNADANVINGFPHRISSTVATSGSENSFAFSQLLPVRLAFDKANVPSEGRVFICDPIVEATLNSLVTITHDVTPFGQKILEQGMARGQRFVMNLYGFDIIQSNRLPTGTF